MVADAVTFEPVSNVKFPANREIIREFRWLLASGLTLRSKSIRKLTNLPQNSLLNRTGNF